MTTPGTPSDSTSLPPLPPRDGHGRSSRRHRAVGIALVLAGATAVGAWGARLTVVDVISEGLADTPAALEAMHRDAAPWCWSSQAALDRRLRALPSVADVTIRCRWPQHLQVHLHGVAPIAWLPTDTGTVMVDSLGHRWPLPPGGGDWELPVIDAPLPDALRWLRHLGEDGRAIAALSVAEGPWIADIGGTAVTVDASTRPRQLRALAGVLADAQQRDSTSRFAADARWNERVVLRVIGTRQPMPASAAAPRRPEGVNGPALIADTVARAAAPSAPTRKDPGATRHTNSARSVVPARDSGR